MKIKHLYPYLAISLAAALWGLIAIFVKKLKDYGFTEMEIVTIRVVYASLFLIIIGLFRYRNQMKIKPNHIHYFIGTGILSIVFFNWCYFKAINQMNVSIAVILLYTSPAFVTVLSYLFLKESLHFKKIVAVGGTIAGCILIAGVSSSQASNLTLIGILTGLGAGLGYALYSIFGKFALRKYQPFTVTFYTFLVAAVFLLPVSRLWTKADLIFEPGVIMYGAGLGLLPTVLAYFVYTWGLEKTESSKASVIATVEPIVATMLGVIVYHEKLVIFQILGSLLILASVVYVNLPPRKGKNNEVDVEKVI